MRLVLAILLLASASPADAGIESLKSLHCTGAGEDFMLTFNHSVQRAAIAFGSEIRTYRYEPGEIFQTWRLLDEEGRQRYLFRQGDTLNGDFGWYFVSLTAGAGDQSGMKSGECKALD